MRFERLKDRVRQLDGIAGWPQMLELIERPVHRDSISIWEYPVATCQAVGGSEDAALPGAAAVFCAIIGIHLVDDMLDQEPHGDFRRLGEGETANLALAFQAAGHLLLDRAAGEPESRAALHASFAGMSLATCFGQSLDARELSCEEEYWRVLEAKTPPLFAEAFRLGALLGGAPREVAEQVAWLGRVLARFIQVSDDLTDALESPARGDWQRRSNNLPILYAMIARHSEQEEFLRLSTQTSDAAALAAAQKILFRCGAVSYCTLRLLSFSREASDMVSRIPLRRPESLVQLLDLHWKPLRKLLEKVGVEDPLALA